MWRLSRKELVPFLGIIFEGGEVGVSERGKFIIAFIVFVGLQESLSSQGNHFLVSSIHINTRNYLQLEILPI